ncbi:MAG: hypothetical protein DME89_01335 [Verrucomicrobia bacterium]|nr:MAG: hypothetical protein DME89_01335 [Verrucomicrobiota bacterium]
MPWNQGLSIGENIFAWRTVELFLHFIAKRSRNYLVRRQSGKRFVRKTAVMLVTFPQVTL